MDSSRTHRNSDDATNTTSQSPIVGHDATASPASGDTAPPYQLPGNPSADQPPLLDAEVSLTEHSTNMAPCINSTDKSNNRTPGPRPASTEPIYDKASTVVGGPDAAVRRQTTVGGTSGSLPHNASISDMTSMVSDWTMGYFKHTKQVVMEKLGKAHRTTDPELEDKMTQLVQTKQRYEDVVKSCEVLLRDIVSSSNIQRLLATQFEELAIKSPELRALFESNAATQTVIAKNSQTLVPAMKFFISNMKTLVKVSMEDTMEAYDQYVSVRQGYDVCLQDIGEREPNNSEKDRREALTIRMAKERARVMDKLDFLHENRIKVLQKQLLVFNNAMCAYYSGNEVALQDAIAEIGTGYDHYVGLESDNVTTQYNAEDVDEIRPNETSV